MTTNQEERYDNESVGLTESEQVPFGESLDSLSSLGDDEYKSESVGLTESGWVPFDKPWDSLLYVGHVKKGR